MGIENTPPNINVIKENITKECDLSTQKREIFDHKVSENRDKLFNKGEVFTVSTASPSSKEFKKEIDTPLKGRCLTISDKDGFGGAFQKVTGAVDDVFKHFFSSSSDVENENPSVEISKRRNTYPTDNLSYDQRMSINQETSLIRPRVKIANAEDLKSQFISKINNYSVDGRSTAEITKELKTYLDSNAIAKLHEGCVSSHAAREKFITFLLDKRVFSSATIDKGPIEITKLIGSEGETLYREAMEEEHNSREFRSAVCLACSQKAGSQPVKPEIILVIGSSASGKTSALNEVKRQMFTEDSPSEPKVNKLISIDGSIEREQSQIARLLLNFSNSQGYQGVVGLHEHDDVLNLLAPNVTSIKKKIAEAIEVNEKKDISTVIPLTYAAQGGSRLNAVSELAMRATGGVKEYVDLAEKRGSGITLIEVAGEKSDDFQNAVAVMGNKRAWAEKGSKAPKINPENTKPSCESKKYNSEHFTEYSYRIDGLALKTLTSLILTTEWFKFKLSLYK